MSDIEIWNPNTDAPKDNVVSMTLKEVLDMYGDVITEEQLRQIINIINK